MAAIYTDFTKAFDSLNHDMLVSVLEALGFNYLDWLHSYIFNKPQWVSIFGFKSNVFTATSGIPQGGHSSPVLFALFIYAASQRSLFTVYF